MPDIIEIETVIIGLGLSAIPLMRELDASGAQYVVISDRASIWDRLEKEGRLDFDLVSSLHTSMYSFELVNRESTDSYPTAKDFSRFIRRYQDQYSEKVRSERVTLVENFQSHSLVHTSSGKTYKCTYLVISTAFKRGIHESLLGFDFDATENRTIALTTMGDSANLIVSKLIPRNNRIILLTNGFLALDKMFVFPYGKKFISATLDQLEFHNIRHVSRLLYRAMIGPGLGSG